MSVDYQDKAFQAAIRTLLDAFPLCGCGTGERNWGIVRAILERAKDRNSGSPSFYEPMPEQDLSAAAVEFIAHTVSESGLMEHGGSIGFAWLTDPGHAVLRFLQQSGADPDGWPEWATCACGGEPFDLDKEALAHTVARMRSLADADVNDVAGVKP